MNFLGPTSYIASYRAEHSMAFKNARGGFRMYRNLGIVEGIKLGVVNVALGTDDPDEAEGIEAMVDELPKFGRQGNALLIDIARRRQKAADIYRNVYQQQRVREVNAVITELTLEAAWNEFLRTGRKKDGSPFAELTKRSYTDTLKRLLEINANAGVRDLPNVLAQYRAKCVASGTLSTFNRIQAGCLSFARNTEPDRQFSQLWREIAKIDGTSNGTKKEPSALPVYEIFSVVEAIPNAKMRKVAWFFALTGCRVGEYWRPWSVELDCVRIFGTKTGAAIRDVPKLDEFEAQPYFYHHLGRNLIRPDEPAVCVDLFNQRLKEVSGDSKFSAGVFRHSYRMWLDECGIPDLRAEVYFGHKGKTLKERYGRTKARRMLHQDTVTLLNYIKANRKKPKKNLLAKIELLKLA